MLFAIATFVVIVLLVIGIYWAMFERGEAREQAKLQKRLRSATGPKSAKRLDFVKDADKLSAVGALDAALSRASGVSAYLNRLIAQADVRLTVGGLLLSSATLFLAGWIVIGWVTRLQWVGLACGVLLAFMPYLVVRLKAKQRMRKFEEQF